jgi:PAS domain S-box-containing protein
MLAKAARRSFAEENERLRARLEELEETLRAIRSGEVDALVVETAGEDQVFTLKSADQTYRLMVEQMQKGAATLSDDGVVLYCNPFLAALLDVPVEAVLGAPLSGFLDEPGAAVSLSGLLQAAERGVSRGEFSFRRGGGSVPTHVSLTLLPLEGAPVFCLIVTDLTERKRGEEERALLERERVARVAAEEANRTAQEEIERRKQVEESLRQVDKERTEILERERIAWTQVAEANRLKDEFVATLSHELRTPLSAIVAWSHVLCRPDLDPVTASRAAEAIDRNVRAQTRLVAEILDMSRIVTGKFQMSVGQVRLSDVIELAADTVRLAAQARDIRLELALDPAAGPVLGDASRLQQVIWNLLSNAIRFAPVGGQVQVRLEAAGSGVELSVTDDGAGIDPAFLPYIFDRFRQADSSSTRRHSGLGLGLAMVRHLVELHGGTVEARNREGRPGAVFIVRLPRREEASTDGNVTR